MTIGELIEELKKRDPEEVFKIECPHCDGVIKADSIVSPVLYDDPEVF